MKPFSDKVALITGAGTGIGFAIAKALAWQGTKVMLNDISENDAINAHKKIRFAGGVCEYLVGDASDIYFIESFVNEAITKFERIDYIICNAGHTLFANFFETKPEQVRKVLEMNLMGSYFLTQAAAKQLRKQGQGGSILLMSSVVGHQAHQYLAAYSMTKAGLEMLAKNLVIELSPYQITINAIAPGATLTERTLEDPNYIADWSRITPIGRPATVEDIASAALFMLSQRHITGQSLVIDGGWTSMSTPPDLSHFN